MIRQAEVGLPGMASSAQEMLHSHTTFLSFVLKQLVPNGQPMLTIFGALAGWGWIFVDFVLKSY